MSSGEYWYTYFTMKIFLPLLVLAAFGICGLAFFIWVQFHNKLNVHSPSDVVAIPEGWKLHTQYVVNVFGKKIAYWHIPVANPKAVVILVHGYSIPGGKPQMLVHAQYLRDAGYSTVLLDLQSFGESEGKKITLGVREWKDVEAVYDEVRSYPEYKQTKVGFLGVSMGAATAIMTTGFSSKGDFVIASVPYSSFDSMFHKQLAALGYPPTLLYPFMHIAGIIELGNDYQQFTPLNAVKKVKVPILLFSARQDEEVNGADATNLYKNANEPKEYWEINSKHDIFDSHPNEFKEKVLGFLDKYIK